MRPSRSTAFAAAAAALVAGGLWVLAPERPAAQNRSEGPPHYAVDPF